MIPIKSFSRRSLFWLLFFMLLLLALIDATAIYGADYIFTRLPLSELKQAVDQSPALQAGLSQIWPIIVYVRALFLPVTIGLFFLFGLVQWLVVRGVFVRVMRRAGMEEQVRAAAGEVRTKQKKSKTPETEAPAAGSDKKQRREENRRYYLHLLAVLQREGRLVDFLEEDLSQYEDAQIGAAVRNIHDNCRKTIEKYLAPKAVIAQNEGDEMQVPADFDPATIKLTGNVTGEPPFSGIVRHRGWRAGKLELPVLSGSGDAQVIAPAEVEIP